MMNRRIILLPALALAATSLSGCVAVAIPAMAGSAMVGSRMDGKEDGGEPPLAAASEPAAVVAAPAPKIAMVPVPTVSVMTSPQSAPVPAQVATPTVTPAPAPVAIPTPVPVPAPVPTSAAAPIIPAPVTAPAAVAAPAPAPAPASVAAPETARTPVPSPAPIAAPSPITAPAPVKAPVITPAQRPASPPPAATTAAAATAPATAPAAPAAYPDPDRPLTDDQIGFARFVRYSQASAFGAKGGADLLSAILSDPIALDGQRRRCAAGEQPVALIDLDPKGGIFSPPANPDKQPGLALGLAVMREAGVVIAWLSDLSVNESGTLRTALERSGLDPRGEDIISLRRDGEDSKHKRKDNLAGITCIVAIAGDERADFDERFRYLRSPEAGEGLEPVIGDGWFLIEPLLGKEGK